MGSLGDRDSLGQGARHTARKMRSSLPLCCVLHIPPSGESTATLLELCQMIGGKSPFHQLRAWTGVLSVNESIRGHVKDIFLPRLEGEDISLSSSPCA